MKIKYIDIAEEWLKEHYPDKDEPVDVKWSAVINFALFLDTLSHSKEELTNKIK